MSGQGRWALSRRGFGQVLLGGAAAAATPGLALAAPTDGLTRQAPESKGVRAEGLLNFFADLEAAKIDMHSFMLWRSGAVVAEGWWWPYRPELPHMMHSLTKSFTVCAVGLAMADGRFGLHDKVASFFPEHLPANPDPRLAEMTVEHLLAMKTGHAMSVSGSVWRPIKTSWIAEFYKIPFKDRPGESFLYTSAATYMLSAIVSKTTGQNTYAYLKPRLFEPLGITGEAWPVGPENITPGANGLDLRTADALKLGILHAQHGRWNGRQILPADWVAQIHAPHTPGRYGWQWWLDPDGAYSAQGLFGQEVIVLPKYDAVIGITSAVSGGGDADFRPALFRHLDSWFGEGARSPALDYKLKGLRALPYLRPSSSPRVAEISGRRFVAQPNADGIESVSFEFEAKACVFRMTDARGERQVRVGLTDWIESKTGISGARLHHEYQLDDMRVVAGGQWLDPNLFEMTWQFNESAFRDRVTCRFTDGGGLALDRSVNVNSGARALPTLIAKLA